MTTYSLEAVRDFTAIDSDNIVVKFGEILTLLLDNSKFCLVHRSDDLPFVVPKPWVVLRIDDCNNRTGSFSKFLRKRECLKLMNKYPMCSYNLESARPQFAAVTTASAATALNEVDVRANTSVLLLNADPQNLSWFGITQNGTFGMIPGNCLSFVTNTMTPSLQAGSRLVTTARITYESQDPGELSITRGTSLEVIGMPQLWKWQVRIPTAKRKVGLLPIYVMNEVSVISSPQDIRGKDADAEKPIHIVRPPSGWDAAEDCDATSLQIVQNAGTSCLRRRNSRQPLPLRPDSQPPAILNDLNRPTDEVAYVNEGHNSFSIPPRPNDFNLSLPRTLRSDDPCLRGVSSAMGDTATGRDYVRSPSEEAKDAIDGISKLLVNLEKAHTALAQTARRSEEQLHHWKDTAKTIQRLTSEAISQNECYYAYAYDHTGWGEDRTMSTAMELDFVAKAWSQTKDKNTFESSTIPRKTHKTAQRRASLSSSSLQPIEENEKSSQLYRCESQPILNMASGSQVLGAESPATSPGGSLLHMPPSLHSSHIEVITKCTCPDGAIRSKIHWKPILIRLGLDPLKAREISAKKMPPREEWKQALLEWKEQLGPNATMPAFLEELKVFRNDIYHEIFKVCGVRLKQKLSSSSVHYV